MIMKNDVKNLYKSFLYAFKGIEYCIKNERNMRIHITATVLVSLFSYVYGLNSRDYVILFLCIGFVICSEMVNTAVETLVNLESPSYHHLAKISKDVAAGAVLVSAIVAVIVGVVLFLLDFNRFLTTLIIIFKTPYYFITFLVIILLGILFIFNGSRLIAEKTVDHTQMNNFKDRE